MGTLVWWWHWFQGTAKARPAHSPPCCWSSWSAPRRRPPCSRSARALFVALRLLFDTDPAAEVVSRPRRRHRGRPGRRRSSGSTTRMCSRSRSPRTRRAGRLVVSAIALIGAASGFGVIVNALLATFGRHARRRRPSHAAARRHQRARGRGAGVVARLATGARGGRRGGRGSGATRLPGGGVRRERGRRDRHAPDHRLPRLRVRPRRRRLGRSRGAHPRAARTAQCDRGRVRLPLRDLAS